MAHNIDSVNILDLWNDGVDNERDSQEDSRDEQRAKLIKLDCKWLQYNHHSSVIKIVIIMNIN